MTINFNNKEIELRFTFRADMLFENAAGVTFTGKNESEWLQYFFCTLVALTKDESLRFDDFLDWISEPQNLNFFYDFIKWYTDFHTSVMEKRQSQQADADEKKKSGSEADERQEEIKQVTHFYFRLLCFDYKVVTVDYFLDKMLITEFYDVMNCLKYTDRAIWESSRLQCFFTAQKNCRKQLKLHDIFPLPWDTNKASISKQDLAELKQQQTQMEALINAHANTH